MIDILKVKASDLKYIVRINEWVHAIFHLGLGKGDRQAVEDGRNQCWLYGECEWKGDDSIRRATDNYQLALSGL